MTMSIDEIPYRLEALGEWCKITCKGDTYFYDACVEAAAILRQLTGDRPEKVIVDTAAVTEAENLLRLARSAAGKLGTMYERRETDRRAELDWLIEAERRFIPSALAITKPLRDMLTATQEKKDAE